MFQLAIIIRLLSCVIRACVYGGMFCILGWKSPESKLIWKIGFRDSLFVFPSSCDLYWSGLYFILA